MKVMVFAGPTISSGDVRQVIEAECLPPAAQGDVYRAALRRPDAIGLIDGYFECVPSVWHKEILWAMSEGIHVFGSASMGALRAAELAAFGMIGVGSVFEAYRDGLLEDDDEVAVAHGPTEESFRFCSDAMVNIRATLARALDEGVVPTEARDALLRIAKGLHYRERSWARVLELARAERSCAGTLDLFGKWLPGGAVNRKREDALAMLRSMQEFLAANPGRKQVSFVFEETLYWEELVRASREVRFESDGGADRIVLDELDRDPEARSRAESAALGWWLASERARSGGLAVEALALLERSREFCERHGLAHADQMTEWRQRNRCGQEDVERLLEGRALALEAQRLAPSAMAAALLDYLRWTGDYATLLDRAAQPKIP